MRIVTVFLLACFLTCGWALPSTANEQPYRIVTGYLPPWSMTGNPLYPGSFVEIVKEAVRRAGHAENPEIHTYPWGRSQALARKEQNVLIFPIARLPQREDHYRWIVPIKSMEMAFVTADQRQLTTLEARRVRRILVHEAAPPEMVLRKHGFDNLISVHDVTPNVLKMLEYGRVDAWFTPKDMAHWVWKESPRITYPTFGDTLARHSLYLAASPDMPEKIVNELNAAVWSMHADGTIIRILSRYRNESRNKGELGY